MIILLSPSKSINFKVVDDTVGVSSPQFLDRSTELATVINKLGKNLATTLGVSEKLAEENRHRFKNWNTHPQKDSSCQSAWAYRGETFAGLSIEKLNAQSLAFAQEHIYIVSGLYGLLRPEDTIMPYRLEMSTKLSGQWGKNLYEFWGSSLADHIASQNPGFILNCASDEYSKAALKHLPKDITVVTPKFLHNGKSKMAFAKYTRGLMARWAAENQITQAQDILAFNAEGYVYDPNLSKPNQPIFTAPENFTVKGRWVKT